MPPNLGALRCEILAVLIGNSLFTKEEQLLANHQVHECEDRQRLLQWLEDVRQEAESREQAAATASREAVQALYCEMNVQANELQRLAKCHALSFAERRFAKTAVPVCRTAGACLSVVGRIYVDFLRRKDLLPADYDCGL